MCAVCLARPGEVLAEVRGEFAGRIGTPPDVPRGANGFGYDPLFLVAPEFTETSAELSESTKNSLSHRGDACRKLAALIEADPGLLRG